MSLPLDIRDLVSSGAKLDAERERQVKLAVFIDAEASDEAVQAIKEALRPLTVNGRIHVEPAVPGDILVADQAADAVIALVGPGATLAESVRRSCDMHIPTVVVALGDSREAVAARIGHPFNDVIACRETGELLEDLGLWLADRLKTKRLALASNFQFVRRAVAEESVKSTSMQNALIGGVVIIPGADMPLMTANQAKMVLQIAAAYGQPLGSERIKELAGVVGGAFMLRTIARQVVSVVPGFGWALKAGIGYTGTLAMGYAAIEYFEQGGDVRGLAERVRQARDGAVQKARSRGRRREVIPAEAYIADESRPAAAPPAAALPSADATSDRVGDL
jgi:uncharacterized protein (DUF697 family)